MSEDQEWVKRRLNSVIDELEKGSKFIGGSSTNIEHYTTKRALEILNKLKEKFPENKSIPEILTREEIQKQYHYAPNYYIYTTVREITDALGIDLNVDQKEQSSPIMAQYQNQVSNQINLQTVDNVIECINSLNIKWEQKTELVQLTKDFEKAVEEKDSGKLKSILKKVAEISPKVAGFLLEHASVLGLGALLLGA